MNINEVKNQVIAGIILLVIAPLATYFLGLWPVIFKVFVDVVKFFGKQSLIYNWVIVLGIIISVFCITQLIISITKKIFLSFNTEEIEILQRIADFGKDGIDLETLTEGFGMHEQKMKYYLRKFEKRELIFSSSSSGIYYLDDCGRDYLMKNNLMPNKIV